MSKITPIADEPRPGDQSMFSLLGHFVPANPAATDCPFVFQLPGDLFSALAAFAGSPLLRCKPLLRNQPNQRVIQ